jgi:hypothetical protein
MIKLAAPHLQSLTIRGTAPDGDEFESIEQEEEDGEWVSPYLVDLDLGGLGVKTWKALDRFTVRFSKQLKAPQTFIRHKLANLCGI